MKKFAVEQGVNYPIVMRTPELAKIFKEGVGNARNTAPKSTNKKSTK